MNAPVTSGSSNALRARTPALSLHTNGKSRCFDSDIPSANGFSSVNASAHTSVFSNADAPPCARFRDSSCVSSQTAVCDSSNISGHDSTCDFRCNSAFEPARCPTSGSSCHFTWTDETSCVFVSGLLHASARTPPVSISNDSDVVPAPAIHLFVTIACHLLLTCDIRRASPRSLPARRLRIPT